MSFRNLSQTRLSITVKLLSPSLLLFVNFDHFRIRREKKKRNRRDLGSLWVQLSPGKSYNLCGAGFPQSERSWNPGLQMPLSGGTQPASRGSVSNSLSWQIPFIAGSSTLCLPTEFLELVNKGGFCFAHGATCATRWPGVAWGVIWQGRRDALLEGARRAELAGRPSYQEASLSAHGRASTVACLSLWILALSLREFGFEIQNSQTTKGWSWKWILLSLL